MGPVKTHDAYTISLVLTAIHHLAEPYAVVPPYLRYAAPVVSFFLVICVERNNTSLCYIIIFKGIKIMEPFSCLSYIFLISPKLWVSLG